MKEKIYLAGSLDLDKRKNYKQAADILINKGFDVYIPFEHMVPHPWEYPNNEWALMTFQNDIVGIDNADFVVILSYGRQCTAGSPWKAGYAFGIGKKVILVEMNDEIQSLMVANGRYATVKGLSGLKEYDFVTLPKLKTDTEQK